MVESKTICRRPMGDNCRCLAIAHVYDHEKAERRKKQSEDRMEVYVPCVARCCGVHNNQSQSHLCKPGYDPCPSHGVGSPARNSASGPAHGGFAVSRAPASASGTSSVRVLYQNYSCSSRKRSISRGITQNTAKMIQLKVRHLVTSFAHTYTI